jgi:hypothetical protein
VLSGLWVGLTPTGSQTELSGRTWEEFAAADPEVARIYSMDLVLLGMTFTAFAILGTILTLIPYRRGERWAWFALWLIPLVHGGMALTMLIDQYSAGYVYLVLFLISLIGILIPIRRFLYLRPQRFSLGWRVPTGKTFPPDKATDGKENL